MGGHGFPDGLLDAVRHFNAGRFFEAHEAFEELLDAVESDRRWDLLIALVQVTVGYHKAAAGHAGALRMLSLGLDKLATFPDRSWGLALGPLRRRVAADVAACRRGESLTARLADPPRLRLVPPPSG